MTSHGACSAATGVPWKTEAEASSMAAAIMADCHHRGRDRPDDLEGLTQLLMSGGFVAADEEAEELLAAAAGDTRRASTRWSRAG